MTCKTLMIVSVALLIWANWAPEIKWELFATAGVLALLSIAAKGIEGSDEL